MLNQEQLTSPGVRQEKKKSTSRGNVGEIHIYYCLSALILQKSLKGKCLNTLGSNLTPFYPAL